MKNHYIEFDSLKAVMTLKMSHYYLLHIIQDLRILKNCFNFVIVKYVVLNCHCKKYLQFDKSILTFLFSRHVKFWKTNPYKKGKFPTLGITELWCIFIFGFFQVHFYYCCYPFLATLELNFNETIFFFQMLPISLVFAGYFFHEMNVDS